MMFNGKGGPEERDFAPQIYHREWLLENNSCRVVDKFGVND